jgi:hypothetical protein
VAPATQTKSTTATNATSIDRSNNLVEGVQSENSDPAVVVTTNNSKSSSSVIRISEAASSTATTTTTVDTAASASTAAASTHASMSNGIKHANMHQTQMLLLRSVDSNNNSIKNENLNGLSASVDLNGIIKENNNANTVSGNVKLKKKY